MRLVRLASPARLSSLLVFVAVAACAGRPQSAPTSSEAPSPAPRHRPTRSDRTAPPSVEAARASTSSPAAPTAAFEGRSIETACNGQDDDGDGLVDVLLPVSPNACETGGKGACGSGIAICEGSQRTCLAPPPMPEVLDGIDNDCNGVVDDVPAASVRPRAIVLAPRYAWTDAGPDIANVTASLAQAGIPFDRPATGSDWASVDALDPYALAVIPGYLLGSVVPRVREKLEAFVERGGVLVVFKPIAEGARSEALALAGLRAGTRRRDVEEIRFERATSPGTAFIDSAEERSLGINPSGEKAGIEVWTFEPDAAARTDVLGAAFKGGATVGAAITRRPLGKGAVYAVGHDLASFAATRCYMNCFESAGDVMRLLLDGALREGSQGHVALLATTPALASSVLVLTHDANTHESQFPGPWGEPGVIQLAEVEKARGVRATFHVMTDYRGGHFNPKTVRSLCELGMCPSGIQGVSHVRQFARMGDGMVRASDDGPWRCKETLGAYAAPSLCGEVFLSSQLVRSAGSGAPRSWRSPHLAYHAELTQVLASAGVLFDSSFGIGDLPYNLPLDMATTGVQQRRFRRRPVLELPLACDDGIELVGDDKRPRERIELQPSTEERFRGLWRYVVLQNQRNRSFTTLRVSASRGEGMPPENLAAKAAAIGRFLDDVERLRPRVVVRSEEEVGEFWRARLDAKLDARFDDASGYVGALTIGKTTAAGLTIELGDAIKTFDCPKCGGVDVLGNRIALRTAPAPGTKVEFSAKVR